MKKILISVSILLSTSAFAQSNDSLQSNDAAQTNNAPQTNAAAEQNEASQTKKAHKNKPFMIQAFLGGGSTDGDNNESYSHSNSALKMLYSPYQFSFAKLILGTGIEQEYLQNYYSSNNYWYYYSSKNRVTTTYILLDAGLEFHPRHNIKIIPAIEYGYGVLSNRYYTVRNNTNDTEAESKEKVTTQKIGITTEGLLEVTENFYMGLDFSYYGEFINTNGFANSGLSLVASYSL